MIFNNLSKKIICVSILFVLLLFGCGNDDANHPTVEESVPKDPYTYDDAYFSQNPMGYELHKSDDYNIFAINLAYREDGFLPKYEFVIDDEFDVLKEMYIEGQLIEDENTFEEYSEYYNVYGLKMFMFDMLEKCQENYIDVDEVVMTRNGHTGKFKNNPVEITIALTPKLETKSGWLKITIGYMLDNQKTEDGKNNFVVNDCAIEFKFHGISEIVEEDQQFVKEANNQEKSAEYQAKFNAISEQAKKDIIENFSPEISKNFQQETIVGYGEGSGQVIILLTEPTTLENINNFADYFNVPIKRSAFPYMSTVSSNTLID